MATGTFSSTIAYLPESRASSQRVHVHRKLMMRSSLGVPGNYDEASATHLPSPSSLLLPPVERDIHSQQLPRTHVGGKRPSVSKETTTERTPLVHKPITNPSTGGRPCPLRPSFYPPIDYNLGIDQNTQRDLLCLSTFARESPSTGTFPKCQSL